MARKVTPIWTVPGEPAGTKTWLERVQENPLDVPYFQWVVQTPSGESFVGLPITRDASGPNWMGLVALVAVIEGVEEAVDAANDNESDSTPWSETGGMPDELAAVLARPLEERQAEAGRPDNYEPERDAWGRPIWRPVPARGDHPPIHR